ncbi:MAG: DUF1684 domain-containing protein [Bacteroidetes bacterium]|nr:DUF1684 domain-containing protein [Bacteroidota bacterium]
MKLKNSLVILLLILVAGFIYYSFFTTDQSYLDEIDRERKEKDEFMKTSKDSPFAETKNSFHGLNYFPPNERYRIYAELENIPEKKIVMLATSDGYERKYTEYAFAKFEMNRKECRLLILEVAEGDNQGTLFLAFADSTSALETYGAGRYLDLKKRPGATSILLDFNKAYNPYCAYSPNYSCPFPPENNFLKVAIRAGEKKYHE